MSTNNSMREEDLFLVMASKDGKMVPLGGGTALQGAEKVAQELCVGGEQPVFLYQRIRAWVPQKVATLVQSG